MFNRPPPASGDRCVAGPPHASSSLFLNLALALVYFGIGHLSVQLTAPGTAANLAYVPAGLGLGAVLFFGVRVWPAIFLGALALGVNSPQSGDASVNPLTCIAGILGAAGGAVEAVLGATLIRFACAGKNYPRSRRQLIRWTLALVSCCLPGAVAACLSNFFIDGGAAPTWQLVLSWWGKDLWGILLVLLLANAVSTVRRPTWRNAETGGLFLSAGLLLVFICSGTSSVAGILGLGMLWVIVAVAAARLPFPTAMWLLSSTASVLFVSAIGRTFLVPASWIDLLLPVHTLGMAVITFAVVLRRGGNKSAASQTRDWATQFHSYHADSSHFRRGLRLSAGILLVTSIMSVALSLVETTEVRRKLEQTATVLQQQSQTLIASSLAVQEQQAAEWNRNRGVPESSWRADARRTLSNFPFLRAVEWVDPQGVSRWREAKAGVETEPDYQADDDSNRPGAWRRTRDQPGPYISDLIRSGSGGVSFLSFAPVFAGELADGFLVQELRFDPLISEARGALPTSAAGFQLVVRDDGPVRYIVGPPPAKGMRRWSTTREWQTHNKRWWLELNPQSQSTLFPPWRASVMLLLFGCLCGPTIGLLQFFRERSRQARARADAIDRSKDQFLASISHEIRTPMNGILSTTELLQGTQLDSKQQTLVEIVARSGQGLLAIINDVLDYSKLEAGRMRLDDQTFELKGLVEGIVQLVSLSGHGKPVKFTTELDERLPRWLRGDPGRLRQVLLNLVGNGLKFTASGAVVTRVRVVSLASDRALVRFEVTDTGEGISSKEQKLLFRAFQQGDSSHSRRHGGTGLGLAISRQLVEMMGGQIGLASSPGTGSTFWFEVPFRPAANTQLAPPDAPRDAERFPPAGLRVLLLEVQPLNRRLSVLALEKLGCRVDTIQNGEDVVERVRRQPYDAVLLDCQASEPDVEEIASAIRELERATGGSPRVSTVLIGLTAGTLDAERDRRLRLSLNCCLVRPLTLQQLRAALLVRTITPDESRLLRFGRS